MTTKDGSAEFKIKSIKDFADAVKQFVAAAVFTGIVTLAQAAIPPDNSNDGSVPSTSWVNKAINAVINSDAFRQHIVVDYLDEQNGFIKFGDWLSNIILQWGTGKTSSGWNTKTSFNISFNEKVYGIYMTSFRQGGSPSSVIYSEACGVKYAALDGFYGGGTNAGTTLIWLALGK